ncbi:MAG: hypothetical protein ACK5O9_00375 [Holosporales bacterium]|jgi:hypothetical protein
MGNIFSLLGPVGLIINAFNLLSGWFGGGGSTSSSDANVLPENITGTTGTTEEVISAATGSSDTERNTTNPSSDTPITITSIKKNPNNPSELWVKYEEGTYKTEKSFIENENTDGPLDEGEFQSLGWSQQNGAIDETNVRIALQDANGETVIIEGTYNSAGNFQQTSTTQDSTDSAESSAVTDLYDFRWAYNSNGEQVLLYRPKGDETDPGTVLTPDADGGSLAENERSTMVWNSGGSSSSYKVNIGGTTYSVPVGVIEVVTATTWGLSGENIQNNEGSETLIVTDSTTTTTAANLTTAVASAFADTGSTIASGINNTPDTTPTTLAATG